MLNISKQKIIFPASKNEIGKKNIRIDNDEFKNLDEKIIRAEVKKILRKEYAKKR